jgi:osmotically-inducible protein OsmY
MRLARILVAVALAAAPALAADTPTDDQIYDAVRQKLATNRDVKGGGIEVEVKDGVVYLRGKLQEPKQVKKAEKVAGKVKGVKKVVNELKAEQTTAQR